MLLLTLLLAVLLCAALIHAVSRRHRDAFDAVVVALAVPFVFARHPVGTRNHEQNTRVVWVPTIADTSAPTAAELSAGTDITSYLTKDGLETPADQNMVDNAGLDTNFNAQGVGNYGGGITLKCFRTSTDAAWDLFVYGTEGYVVVARDSIGGIASGDDVEVYPAQMHQPVMMNTAENERQKFSAKLAVTSAPVDGTVAA